MKLGLVIGRFQPLHEGHVNLIQKSTEENDMTLVILGSACKLPDHKNPLSTFDREALIRNAFPDDEKVIIRAVEDFPMDSQWIEEITAHVISIQEDPSKVTLYTSEKDSKFYKSNFLFQVVEQLSEGVHATLIREFMYTKDMVASGSLPKHVTKFLEDFITTDEFKRLQDEYNYCFNAKEASRHPFNNCIEPVAHAVVFQDEKILLVKRAGARGRDQWALPGGYIDHLESTRSAALRELHEETGIDLMKVEGARELAQAVEENMKDLGVRTIGINYLYAVPKDVELNPVAGDDAQDVDWVPLKDILEGEFKLFYNHQTVIARLLNEYNAKGQP